MIFGFFLRKIYDISTTDIAIRYVSLFVSLRSNNCASFQALMQLFVAIKLNSTPPASQNSQILAVALLYRKLSRHHSPPANLPRKIIFRALKFKIEQTCVFFWIRESVRASPRFKFRAEHAHDHLIAGTITNHGKLQIAIAFSRNIFTDHICSFVNHAFPLRKSCLNISTLSRPWWPQMSQPWIETDWPIIYKDLHWKLVRGTGKNCYYCMLQKNGGLVFVDFSQASILAH